MNEKLVRIQTIGQYIQKKSKKVGSNRQRKNSKVI